MLLSKGAFEIKSCCLPKKRERTICPSFVHHGLALTLLLVGLFILFLPVLHSSLHSILCKHTAMKLHRRELQVCSNICILEGCAFVYGFTFEPFCCNT
mmetsp:Transcript_12569/g.17546  ORF Transcript_12569/g.17546 Transcript_12569/m.17546 type:complete len:98 (+) Transcript_12569:357-650(+)